MNIKALRDKLGLTQLQMAVKLKVDTGTISRWERGEAKPHKAILRRIERLERKVL